MARDATADDSEVPNHDHTFDIPEDQLDRDYEDVTHLICTVDGCTETADPDMGPGLTARPNEWDSDRDAWE